MQTFLTQPRVAKAILLEKDKMLATLMEDQKAEGFENHTTLFV
jgi:hypothetical protein